NPKYKEELIDNHHLDEIAEKIAMNFNDQDHESGFICAYDPEFPVINKNVKNNSEKPYLLFYRGDISLLSNLNNNVAVIGLLDPDEDIYLREQEVVKQLVNQNLVIVSGLATGCDTIAHQVCLEHKGKTIAILPSPINKIYPNENNALAEEIVNNGGLLISEYYQAPTAKHEAIKRFIDRDRLQAMFAKAIILVASYRHGEGDSGSRHAMEAAKKYEISRYKIYNPEKDQKNSRFGLNKDLDNEVKTLYHSSIEMIKIIDNYNLKITGNPASAQQYIFF
ncbi:MAG: hypothetical protein RLZZ293_355, partial [Pseudomonadota bacterium]